MLDGDVGAEAFAVIREAINKEGMVAIGKVVFTSREHIIALEVVTQAESMIAAKAATVARSKNIGSPPLPAGPGCGR